MGQHTNIPPMSAEQRVAHGKSLRLLATPAAQAGTIDPESAAEFIAQLADKYDPPTAAPATD
jgi:hypothetical protein